MVYCLYYGLQSDLTHVNVFIACEQALHLGESRDVTREQHSKGDTSALPLARAFSRSYVNEANASK